MISSYPGYLALAVPVVLTLATILRPAAGWWRSRRVFAGLLAIAVVSAHAPFLGRAAELGNPDEALLMSAGLTLREDFAPWLSVDLGTAGPLSMLPLLVKPDSFVFARCCAAICSALVVTLGFLSVPDRPLARAGALAVTAFFAFMQDAELFQFSTEHVAAVLLAVAGWIWFSSAANEATRRLPAFALGLCLGAAVMAKLQSAVCAAWLAGAAGFVVLMDRTATRPEQAKAAAQLIAGCVAVPLAFIMLAAAQDVLPDLVRSYGLNNVHYVRSGQAASAGFQPAMVWGLNYLLKPAAVFLGLGLLAWPKFTTPQRRGALVAAGWLVAAIFSIVLPGTGARHYWFLVLGPVLIAFGSLVPPAWEHFGVPRFASGRTGVGQAGLLLLLLALPVAHRLRTSRDEALARAAAEIETVRGTGQELRGRARPGDRLVVWGWKPELYAHSGLPQGARDAATSWLIEPIPQQAYYRQRFLVDLARTQPRFVADSVGPRGFCYTDRAAAGHETFPELRDLIRDRYEQFAETDGIRLYVRREP